MEHLAEQSTELNEAYDEINQRMNIAYRFITGGYQYYKRPIDYGFDISLGMQDVHTLSVIATNPGVTTADIRRLWNNGPTLSAVSQKVNRLLKSGLIEQRRIENDGKSKSLYTTPLGEALHQAHIRYDLQNVEEIMHYLRAHVSEDELDIFFKVMQVWNNWLRAHT